MGDFGLGERHGAIAVLADCAGRSSANINVTRAIEHVSDVMPSRVNRSLAGLSLCGLALDNAVGRELEADFNSKSQPRRGADCDIKGRIRFAFIVTDLST